MKRPSQANITKCFLRQEVDPDPDRAEGEGVELRDLPVGHEARARGREDGLGVEDCRAAGLSVGVEGVVEVELAVDVADREEVLAAVERG